MSLLNKAFQGISGAIRKASKGTLSSYTLNAPPQYGQPLVTPGDASGLISPERMREIVRRTATVAACGNAILDYCTNVPILVRNIDPAIPADEARATIVQAFLDNPNDFDSPRHFRSKLIWDLLVLGFAAIEIEQNKRGRPAKLHVLDAARLRVDYDEHGTVLGYDMLDAHGMPIRGRDGIHAWLPAQIIFLRRDPVSNSLYPLSRVAQLFSAAVIEDMMMAFIGGKFTESNVPYGIYNMGDVTDDEIRKAISLWNDQATSNHRIMLTGSRGTPVWTQFGYALKDLEATQLLSEVRRKIMAILGVTENELGESQDVNKSSGYNLSYTFKRRAIEPILNEITETMTLRLVKQELSFHDLALYYEEIDSRDELLQAQIDEINIKSGIWTPNHVKNRKGLPSVTGGDDSFLVIGTTAVPLDLLRPFAEAQLQVVQAEIAALQAPPTAGTQGAAKVNPPATRGPQPPMASSVPDGRGSSEVRISYPRAHPQSENPTKIQGPVHANRAVGMRQDK